MLRRRLRALFEHGLGVPGRALLAWRTRGQAERLIASRGLIAPGLEVARALKDTVVRGPFAGLRYPRRRGDIVHAAKLLGSYEMELHGAVERLIARRPALIVNVGSGDGYYAVGFAQRLAATTVIAVDPDPLAQRACAATATLNGVERRVVAHDRCDARKLDLLARGTDRTLIVADCEGYEDALLDPETGSAIAFADILVETHDFAVSGVTARLTARFAHTHDIETIAITARDIADYPELRARPDSAGLLDEFRHQPQAWLLCLARAR